MQLFTLDHLSILHFWELFGFEMPYMYLKLCKSGNFHHIILGISEEFRYRAQ